MRRFGIFLLVIATMLAGLILPAALTPAPAEASITSIVWLDTAYKGYDPLLDTNVQAYQSGDTAVLKVAIQNTTGNPITINGAKVKFDWTGGQYAATAGNYPTTLASYESGMVTIGFTVPDTSVASNQVRHSYTVSVDYEKEGGYKAGTQVTRENVGGAGAVRHLDHDPVDPSTLQVFIDGVPTTAYTLDCFTGIITFNVAPPGGASVSADYQYVEYVGTGDGTETVFYLNNYPIVPGSEKVYVNCTLASSSSYTIDNDTGKIKFNTAPSDGQHIIANYQYAVRWTESGDDFAVYSSDQSAAMAVKQQLAAVGSPAVATAGSRELLAKSAMEEQLGDQEYAAGNVDDAKAHYDQAFVYLEKALKNDKDPNTFKLLEPTGTLLLGIGMVLLALGVIVFVLKKPKGPSST